MGHTIQTGRGNGTKEGGGGGASVGHPLVEPLTASRFGEVLQQCLPCLQAAARKLALAWADAADLVQATVLRAFEKRHRFTFLSDTRFRGWLVAIMRNIHCDLARKRRREVLRPTLSDLPDRSPDEPTPAWRLVGDDVLEQAVRALPPKLQQPYMLFAVDGLSYSDIASRLRVPSVTIGTRIHRARERLRVGIETRTAGNARRAA
jgi:RNA polymerase sigma factor (sigma-70 family)